MSNLTSKPAETAGAEQEQEILRFGIHFRIQHVILFVTFLVLAFTGWGLKYAHINESHWMIRWSGGPEMAGIIHRIAGIAMLLDFLYHLVYMAMKIVRREIKWRMNTTLLPVPKDVFDLVQNFAYFLGISKEKPKFGRFTYAQKFDYWAVFWGMAIIGTSGLALAFPVQASAFMPAFTAGWIWQLLEVMHSDEALLAVVFILFWHFYNEHLKPAVFPMSWVWLTGRISVEEMKELHPLEYELIQREKERA